MKGFCKLALVTLVACGGCTTVSLTEYTILQNRTAGECRDRAVLDCLASVAANPETLPSYALYSNGTMTLTDTLNPGYLATLDPGKAASHAVTFLGSRSPRGVWTVSPSAEFERLEAFRAACLWALFGPERACAANPEILGSAQDYLNQKPHFGVASRLAKLPPGWLGFGALSDVPPGALYKSHCGKTWVWVMPDAAEAFAQFVLAFQDIATLEINTVYSPPLVVQLTTYTVTQLKDSSDPTKAVTISTTEARAVKPEYRDYINTLVQTSLRTGDPVNLIRSQWIAYTDPWTRPVPVLSPAPSLPSRTTAGISLPAATSPSESRLIRPAPELRIEALAP
jgi:hypothetical protein